MQKPYISILFLFVTFFQALQAQNPIVRNYTYKDFGTSSLVWHCIQDRNNFLYFANNDGVIIYDGSNWKLIETENPVRQLAFGPGKIIFVGGKEDFGALVPNETYGYEFVSYKNQLDPKQQLSFNEIIGIQVIGNQATFISDKSIFVMDISKSDSKPVRVNTGDAIEGFGFAGNEILVYSEKQLVRTFKNNSFASYTSAQELSKSGIYKSVKANSKNLFVTLTDELYFYENGNFSRFRTDVDSDFEKFHIIDVAIFANGDIAVGTYSNGVYVVNSQGKLVRKISKSNLIPDNNIYSVFVDSQQNLWVGHAKGISQVLLSLPIQRFSIESNGGKISDIQEYQGELYFAATTGLFKKTPQGFIAVNGLENSECWALETWNNRLYVASNDGIYEFNSSKLTPIFKEKAVYYLKAQNSTLWFAGQDCAGDITIENSNLNIKNLIQNVSLECNSILKDGKGNIWIGTNYKGLVKFIPPSTAKFYSKEDGLSGGKSIVHFVGNQLLVQTSHGYFVQTAEDKFVSLESLKEAKYFVFVNDNYFVTYDQTGIYPYKVHANQFVKDSVSLLKFKKELPTAFFEKDGTAWVAYMEELLMIRLSGYKHSSLKTFIRFIQDSQKELFGGVMNEEDQKTQSITLPYGASLKLYAASSDLMSGKSTAYQFKIGGIIERWTDFQNSPDFSLTGISEGRYTFHVRSQAADGTFGEPALIHVYIAPPWYRSYPAYIAYLLGIVMIVWSIVRYNQKRLEARNKELEKIVEEKTADIQKQKAELEEINHEIQESIRYAKRIQEAILPQPSEFASYFDIAHFYIPRDVISGDFYFFDKQGDNIFLIVADCTGHGVPGALLTMLGQNSLQSIISENAINEPAEILMLLDIRIQVLLRQQGGTSKDGMDMVLVKFNTKNYMLEYAGANRPLFVIKKDGDLVELKPDRFPVGGDQYTAKHYTPRIIQLEKGDRFYMSSDGIVDQFGGNDDRKFTAKRFRNILLESRHKNIGEQVADVYLAFEEWKKDGKQTDDATLLGFEIK